MELQDKHKQYSQGGGRLKFQDWIKALAKGAGIAATARNLPRILASATGSGDQTPQPEEPAPQEPEPQAPQDPTGPAPETQQAEQGQQEPAPQLPPEGPRESALVKEFEGSNRMNLLKAIVQGSNNPTEVVNGLRNLYGPRYLQELQAKYRKSPEELAQEAMEVLSQEQPQQQEQQAENVPQGTMEQTPSERQATEQQPSEHSDLFQRIFNPEQMQPLDVSRRTIKPIENALKSSNVRGATYNADKNSMRVVFAPKSGKRGSNIVYEYENVDPNTFETMTGGKAKPITEGGNEFGIWFQGKNKSVGAAFSKYIKKNPDQFPFTPQEGKAWTKNERQIVEADRSFLASSLFEPFESLRKEGRKSQVLSQVKEAEQILNQFDDEAVNDVLDYIYEELQKKLKTPVKPSQVQKKLKKEFL